MQELNLPTYSFKIKSEGDHVYIFDPFRKKFVILTPEEWVRQNIAAFLVNERNVPGGRLVIEKSLKVNELSKRCDILVYGNDQPRLLVECKAPSVRIDQSVFDQVLIYNMNFRLDYLLVSNGLKHFALRIQSGKAEFLDHIPDYKEIIQ